MFDTLVELRWFQAHLQDPGVVVVDCRFSLADAQAGRRAYLAGHVPGAVYADLEQDLSGPVGPETGRHPLPDPMLLARRFAAWGIGPDTQVVALDDAGGAMAARLWWLARWLGHRQVALLDGGYAAWNTAGLPLETGEVERPPAVFDARTGDDRWVDAGCVAETLALGQGVLIDARAPARFAGEEEPIDPVAGHVPGALNRPFTANLDDTQCFLPPETLRAAFRSLLGDTPSTGVMHMCGSGVTACHNLLAMEVAGMPGSRLYAGSWSEWIRDPARPVARGD
ncbi:MAG: sulfurtransferase [Gammaproteobacteria bacterium]|nr:sulfurtransferase [Gammaproteobacteria bacterium]MDX5374982.1 sulfurtransferase [Gammaproteobacteria bacterium]